MLHFTHSTLSLVIVSSNFFQYAAWKRWGESALLERVTAATICMYISVVPKRQKFRGIFKPSLEEIQTVIMSLQFHITKTVLKKMLNRPKYTILVRFFEKRKIFDEVSSKRIHSISSFPYTPKYGNCSSVWKKKLCWISFVYCRHLCIY